MNNNHEINCLPLKYEAGFFAKKNFHSKTNFFGENVQGDVLHVHWESNDMIDTK